MARVCTPPFFYLVVDFLEAQTEGRQVAFLHQLSCSNILKPLS